MRAQRGKEEPRFSVRTEDLRKLCRVWAKTAEEYDEMQSQDNDYDRRSLLQELEEEETRE